MEKPSNRKANVLFLEDLNRFDFDETVEKLTDEVQKRSWNVSFIHDLQLTLRKHGKEVLPVKVFAICHPRHSSRLLDKDDERLVSSMMPCRISVYRKSDGMTYISRMNTGVISSALGGLTEQVMKDSASEVEEIIAALIRGN